MKKVCVTCKVEKDLEYFHNSKKTQDGKAKTCKECRKNISKKSINNNYDKYKEKWTEQNEKRKEAKTE